MPLVPCRWPAASTARPPSPAATASAPRPTRARCRLQRMPCTMLVCWRPQRGFGGRKGRSAWHWLSPRRGSVACRHGRRGGEGYVSQQAAGQQGRKASSGSMTSLRAAALAADCRTGCRWGGPSACEGRDAGWIPAAAKLAGQPSTVACCHAAFGAVGTPWKRRVPAAAAASCYLGYRNWGHQSAAILAATQSMPHSGGMQPSKRHMFAMWLRQWRPQNNPAMQQAAANGHERQRQHSWSRTSRQAERVTATMAMGVPPGGVDAGRRRTVTPVPGTVNDSFTAHHIGGSSRNAAFRTRCLRSQGREAGPPSKCGAPASMPSQVVAAGPAPPSMSD